MSASEEGITPEVTIVTSMGSFTVEMYYKHSPRTCRNFIELSRRGYYNNVKFHRIIKDFIVQGGDPTGTGRGGESIYGAKFEDEIKTELKHTGAGILSMANAGPNTNGSQFFITLAPTQSLDGKHTIFGRVCKGMEIIKRLGSVQTDNTDRQQVLCYTSLDSNTTDLITEKTTMAVVASAPGKVLMTGGYLILDRPNPGLVLSTNARFYAIVKPIYDTLKPDSWAWGWTDVKLTSPQLSREITYKMSLKNYTLQCISSRGSANPFVEQAVQFSVAAARAICIDEDKKDILQKLLLQGLDITILGSNDFYSYRNQLEALGLPLTPESLASLPPFSSITFNAEGSTGNNCKPEVAKTGLGSSAAMTAAVVAAILEYLGAVKLPLSTVYEQKNDADLDLVHVVAQSAHCIAQGKVGSGFDVSAAVYGSQRYVRFSPGILSSAQVAVNGLSFQEAISDVLKENWDHEKTKFSLPPLMTLLLGEPGTGGSSTPSMVGAVKKWQASEPQKSMELWRILSEANSILEIQLKLLSKFAAERWEDYKSVIYTCSGLTCEQWTSQATDPFKAAVVKALIGARDAILQIRFNMRLMGNEAGVPIEPETQTQLLDATMNMEGVLLAGVPGAGGFDAIFAVTLGELSSNNLSKMWSSRGVLGMLVREDPRGVSLESDDPRTGQITSAISSVHV